MKKSTAILLLLLPLVISGCFSLAKRVNNVEESPEELTFHNESIGEAVYTAKYFADWQVEKKSTGDFGEANDEVTFKVNKNQKIVVKLKSAAQEPEIVDSLNVESQQQTEVSRLLANRYLGTQKANGELIEALLVRNGDYLYFIFTNNPGVSEFISFLNNFTIKNNLNQVKEQPAESEQRKIYKVYFGLTSSGNCEATYYREIYLQPPAEEIVYIPLIIKALLSPDQLRLEELKLFTAIPLNTKLLSFGYDNNQAIVNFSKELNSSAGSCEMQMRKSQIAKTLLSLSEVTNLQIKSVEIQVEGKTEGVLVSPY